MTHAKNIFVPVIGIALAIFLFTATAFPASAATLSLGSQVSTIMKLEAKIKYLTAWIEALKQGELTPAPTVNVLNSGDTITLIGTLVRDQEETRIEVCGPMEKGTIDWDDGEIEPIMGLGCSGGVHEFVAEHEYSESGARHILITDGQGRSTTHVVWAIVK